MALRHHLQIITIAFHMLRTGQGAVKPIKLYWCRGSGRSDQGQQNFGDYLSALIVEMLSKRKVVHASVKHADMIAIGSVLSREKKAKIWGIPRKLHIWGTGSASPDDSFSGRHYYHAVRGVKTLGQIKNTDGLTALGDPGLLAPMLVERPLVKSIRVGVIPHIKDRNSPAILDLITRIPGARVIDVFSPVKVVLEQIASCDFVLSSSLHGLIVADSYGVPNQWLSLDSNPGWEYKFQDYYSSFAIEGVAPISPKRVRLDASWSVEECVENYFRPGLEDIQKALVKAFPFT